MQRTDKGSFGEDSESREHMNGQMTIGDYQKGLTYDRRGRKHEAPEWMKKDRCEMCRHWELLPTEEQPPDGWGVKGQCNFLREGQKKYENTNTSSWCQEFKSRY